MDNKISRLQPQVELIASLEDRINFLEKQCDQFAKELRESSNKCATAEGNLSVALYARNDAYNKLDLMQNNLDHLQAEFLKASRRAQDELDMHDQTRMV
jgi:chromosome segregation ATPase